MRSAGNCSAPGPAHQLGAADGTRPKQGRFSPRAPMFDLSVFPPSRRQGGARQRNRRVKMKTTLIPAIAGFALMAGIGIAAADEVIVTPEQQTVVKEYVHK